MPDEQKYQELATHIVACAQAAKEFILRELESAPAESSVSVSANGHADTVGNRSVSILLSASPKT